MAKRGAGINPTNRFHEFFLSHEYVEGIDEWEAPDVQTKWFEETPKTVLSKNNSQDIHFDYSINPYQGCEHGCIYCYARNSHEYWGFSAGQDFESKIIVKKNAASLLEHAFLQKSWKPQPVALSGNTDCYQPTERKLKLTRALLKVFLKYRNPVSIITKNSLILRDLDILRELAALDLVHVSISITTLDEKLRQVMEPRTATAHKRLETVLKLREAGIPVNVMVAPIIPWLNHHEIPEIMKRAAQAGANNANYTVVRLNGAIASIFSEWVQKHFPNRASRVLEAIKSLHGGKVNDTTWKRRMKGGGNLGAIIKQLFETSRRKYFYGRDMPAYNLNSFRRQGNYSLFE